MANPFRVFLAFGVFVLLPPVAVSAGGRVDEVVVSATGIPTPADQTGASVSVLDARDLARLQEARLQDVLRHVGGVSTYSSGGPGTTSGVFLRGLAGKYSVVRIDGMQLNSPVSQQAEWAHVTALGLERVEVLRGSHGVLYGSEAVGGVVSLFTAHGGPSRRSLKLEAGSYGTHRAAGFMAGQKANLDYGAAFDFSESGGFSAADENNGNTEADGHRHLSGTGRFVLGLGENFSLDLAVRHVDSEVEHDDFAPQDAGDATGFRSRSGKLGLVWQGDGSRHSLDLVTTEDRNRSTSAFSTLATAGARDMLVYQGQYRLDGNHRFLFGLEAETEEYADGAQSHEAGNRSVHLLWQGRFGRDAFLTLAARADDQEESGRHETGRMTLVKGLAPKLKMRANYGTGFRSPGLFELYGRSVFCQEGVCGNRGLRPEESASWDVGLVYGDGKNISLEAGYFEISVENLIAYQNGTYVQQNGESGHSGVELAAGWRTGDALDVSANYTYLDSRKADGTREIRRPRHTLNINVNARLGGKFSANLSLLAVRDAVDADFSAFPNRRVALDDYSLLNLAAVYRMGENARMEGKISNALDEEYQTVFGFGTSDRSFDIGVRFDF